MEKEYREIKISRRNKGSLCVFVSAQKSNLIYSIIYNGDVLDTNALEIDEYKVDYVQVFVDLVPAVLDNIYSNQDYDGIPLLLYTSSKEFESMVKGGFYGGCALRTRGIVELLDEMDREWKVRTISNSYKNTMFRDILLALQ